jgi:hypothetical protein
MVNNKTLTVRNIEQAGAWLELDGQISDGQWENARPYDHYKIWCEADVRVATPGEPVGRNFYAQKSNYNFTSPDLLNIVGLRMLATVRIARRFGIEVASLLEHVASCEGTVDTHWETYHKTEFEKAAKIAGFSTEAFVASLLEAVADTSYTMKDLKVDLKDLKAIIKMPVR